MSNPSPHNRQEGSALLIVLWVVVSCAPIVTSFNSTVIGSTNMLESDLALAEHRSDFESAVAIAAGNLMLADDSLKWPQDGTPAVIRQNGKTVQLRIFDENGKADLNKSDPKLIESLVAKAGGSSLAAKTFRQRILHQRGKVKKLGDKTRKRGFMHASLIREFPGVTPELYRQLIGKFTVYGSSGAINPMTASQSLLAAVPGLGKSSAERIAATRKNGRSALEASGLINKRSSNFLQINSGPAYTIEARIETGKGLAPLTSTAVILLTPKDEIPYRILAWNLLESAGPD